MKESFGFFHAVDRKSGGFFACGVGANGFAELFGSGGGVEEIVGNLKSFTDGGAISGGSIQGGGGSGGGEDAHAAGADDQISGFVLLNVPEAICVGGKVFAEHVFDLAADDSG